MDSGGWLERRLHTNKGKGDKTAQASGSFWKVQHVQGSRGVGILLSDLRPLTSQFPRVLCSPHWRDPFLSAAVRGVTGTWNLPPFYLSVFFLIYIYVTLHPVDFLPPAGLIIDR